MNKNEDPSATWHKCQEWKRCITIFSEKKSTNAPSIRLSLLYFSFIAISVSVGESDCSASTIRVEYQLKKTSFTFSRNSPRSGTVKNCKKEWSNLSIKARNEQFHALSEVACICINKVFRAQTNLDVKLNIQMQLWKNTLNGTKTEELFDLHAREIRIF